MYSCGYACQPAAAATGAPAGSSAIGSLGAPSRPAGDTSGGEAASALSTLRPSSSLQAALRRLLGSASCAGAAHTAAGAASGAALGAAMAAPLGT